MLLLTPLVVAGLAWFLRKSRFGLAIRASAANPDAARMAGVFGGRMSTLSWAIAGAVSALTAILVLPTRGFANAQFLGPGLLRAPRPPPSSPAMTSLPLGLAAGLGVGIIEQVLLWNYPAAASSRWCCSCSSSAPSCCSRDARARDDEKGSWASVQPWPPLPERLKELWPVRNLGWITAGRRRRDPAAASSRRTPRRSSSC